MFEIVKNVKPTFVGDNDDDDDHDNNGLSLPNLRSFLFKNLLTKLNSRKQFWGEGCLRN